MRCTKCNYSLWNLLARTCPECGQPFKPSEFTFTPGAVRFHCPHCNKAYYGTDEAGLLIPRAFTCVGCGRPIEMDEMVLSPAAGVREDQTAGLAVPWLERTEKGPVRSFFKTVWWALVHPKELGQAVPAEGAGLSSWWFLALVQLVAWGVGVGSIFLMMLAFAPAAPPGAAVFGIGIAGLVGVAFTVVIFAPLWALTAHGLLRLSGPTQAGMSVTLAGVFFAGGTTLIAGIPIVGMVAYYFAPLWWLISATIIVKVSQRVSAGRAVLSVAPFPVICVVLVIGTYAWLIVYSVRMAPAAMAAAQTAAANASAAAATGAGRAASLSAALARSAAVRPDGTAAHPLKLLADTRIQPDDLIIPGLATDPDAWTVCGDALSVVPLLPGAELDNLMARVNTMHPESPGSADEIRLGDVVFLTGNMSISNAPSGLWTFIVWPDPTSNPKEDPAWPILIGTVGGGTLRFTVATFDSALEAQNTERKAQGLPPIHHPRDVAH